MKNTHRILIVDDIPSNIKILADLLQEEYKISVATNGPDALELVQKEAPDIILLDIMMPGMDGYEVCQQLKVNERSKNIPVIFVTAKTEIEDEQHGLELGAVDYITKPISPPIVLARVRNHIALKEARDHLEELVFERTCALQLTVRELKGRDRLVRFQMMSHDINAAHREILLVLSEVLDTVDIAIFLPEKSGSSLQVAVSLDGFAGDASQDDSPKSGAALQLATKAFQEKKVLSDNGLQIAAPIIYKDEVLGVIWVSLPSFPGNQSEETQNILWRMATEAAMVMRMAMFTEDLQEDRVDFDELMDLAEQNL